MSENIIAASWRMRKNSEDNVGCCDFYNSRFFVFAGLYHCRDTHRLRLFTIAAYQKNLHCFNYIIFLNLKKSIDFNLH